MADGHPVEDALQALKDSIEKLRHENAVLEKVKAEQTAEIDDYIVAADEAEEARDNALAAKEEAHDTLRGERRKALALLRRLEFSLHGLCPLCLGLLEHKTGCDMKLEIFRLDLDLNRAEYVHP